MKTLTQHKHDTGGWSAKFGEETRKQRHPLPKLVGLPDINYSGLQWLCGIEGLGERDRPSTSEAHEFFLANYPKMFNRPRQQTLHLSLDSTQQRKLNYMDGQLLKAQETKIPHDKGLFPHWCKGFNPSISHNISDHLSKLHKHSVITMSPDGLLNMRIKAIKRVLRKQPFERKSKDNEALFKHLQYFPELADQVPNHVLKELCSVAQLDKCPEEEYTVFGHTGLHLILRGSVMSESSLAFSPVNTDQDTEFASPASIPEEDELQTIKEKLSVGQCFGTLSKDEGREPNSGLPSVVSLEPCEFLKISTSDYARVIQIIQAREEEQKLSLAKVCKLFNNWPLLSLKKIAGLIKWRKFPPGQVLVSEGERCEVIGFIKKGDCLLRRYIEVAHTFPNGKKEQRTKSVMIGRLSPGDSFGESTVIKGLPMPCSVITDTPVQIGTISTLDVHDLDEVTRSLLSQSYSAMDANLTEDEIQKKYIEQEKEKEWFRFKNKVVSNVLHHRGILPGYSKWSRNPSPLEVPDK
ncbi:hypothetical protein ACROYT_G012241 [Oculina patagonica]